MRCLLFSMLMFACQERPLPFVGAKDPASGDLNTGCRQGQVSAACPVEISNSPSPQAKVPADEPKVEPENEDKTVDRQSTTNSYSFGALELQISPYPHVGGGEELKFTFRAVQDIAEKTKGNKKSYTLRIAFPDPSSTLTELSCDVASNGRCRVSDNQFFSDQKLPYRGRRNQIVNHFIANIKAMAEGDSFDLTFTVKTTEEFIVKVTLDNGNYALDKDNNYPKIVPPP